MVPKEIGNQSQRASLLVANVSTERLGNCGIIYYWTNLLGKCTLYTVTPFFHCKNN